MNFLKINYEGIVKCKGNFLFTTDYNSEVLKFEIRSYFDFEDLLSFDLSKEFSLTLIYNDLIIVSNSENEYYQINLSEKIKLELKRGDTPLYMWDGLKLINNKNTNSKNITDDNSKIKYSFKWLPKLAYFYVSFGLLEIQKRMLTNNYLRCINPDGGAELWRLDLPWHIGKIDIYEHYIIFEYREYPKVYESGPFSGEIIEHERIAHIICLDGNTGQELWRRLEGYQKIDSQYGVILTGLRVADEAGYRIGSRTIELDIATGKELTNQLLTPFVEDSIFVSDFVDETAIYYRHDKGAFGKINKADGSIVWEFFLIDENNKKRILGNWLKLGNGKFVLQALTHTKNGENLGELMCIFDPEENMAFSNIKNGVRVNPLGMS